MASPDATPDASLSRESAPQPAPAEASAANTGDAPHNFDVQKDLHRRIRNDPDYDDWEYGTEPLPHEAWPAVSSQAEAEKA